MRSGWLHNKTSVTDQGIGIAYENQQKVFQKFNKMSGNRSSGTGPGLAIMKELVEAMGGSIDINSREGQEATFG